MTEEENVSVETEESQVAAPAAESENAQEKQVAATEKKARDDQAYNWAETRRKMQELEKKSKEQEEVIHRLTQPKSAVIDDELDKLGDGDIVTKGQVKKLAQKMAEEIAHKVIKQRDDATVEDRLQHKYSDFNQVVTKENIENLKEIEPELAESLSHISDPYAQAVAAYKYLKKSGIGANDMAEVSKEKEKAVKNSQKPISVNAVTKQSAIGNAHMFENGLTKELKTQLLKEMRDCAKRA